MGLFDKILDLVAGKDPEVKQAEEAMRRDAETDTRRKTVFGVLAVTYDVDPAYLKEHAMKAIRDWYGVKSVSDLDKMSFGTKSHLGYNAYRHTFLARTAFAAGLLNDAESWSRAFKHAQSVLDTYKSWDDYGQGYLAGHLEYRKSCGDSDAQLAQYKSNINTRLAALSQGVWKHTPFSL